MDLEEYIVQFSRGVDLCKEITHFESDKVRYSCAASAFLFFV